MTAPQPGPAAGAPPTGDENVVVAEGLTLAYDRKTVCEGLDVSMRRGAFTVVVGPNACGKSTLLKALARILTPRAGRVLLDGLDIHRTPRREVARRIGLLAQSALAPEGIGVADLVARGRFPYQSAFSSWTEQDEAAVVAALTDTNLLDLASVQVSELSGGQRQRVWVAMALAQDTEVLLLDEPTTFLDISHQLGILDLFARLNRDTGRTLVAVLHDLNQAARYADDLVVMKAGRVVAQGPPADVLTADLIADVFDVDAVVVPDPVHGTPMMIAR